MDFFQWTLLVFGIAFFIAAIVIIALYLKEHENYIHTLISDMASIYSRLACIDMLLDKIPSDKENDGKSIHIDKNHPGEVKIYVEYTDDNEFVCYKTDTNIADAIETLICADELGYIVSTGDGIVKIQEKED